MLFNLIEVHEFSDGAANQKDRQATASDFVSRACHVGKAASLLLVPVVLTNDLDFPQNKQPKPPVLLDVKSISYSSTPPNAAA